MTEKSAFPFRRVLVEFGPSEMPRDLLDTAVRLASAIRADLSGLFIEDSALIDLAGLPFARALPTLPGRARELHRSEMEAALSALAHRCKRDLAVTAEAARVRWSFEVLRGERQAVLRTARARSDIVVLSTGAESVIGPDPLCALREVAADVAGIVLVRRGIRQRAGGPVVLLAEPGTTPGRSAGIARDIASANGVPLALVELPGDGEGETAGRPVAAGEGVRHDMESVLSELERRRPSFVVADAGLPLFGDEGMIRRILLGASAPLLLVGGAR